MVAVGIDLGTTNSCVAIYNDKDIKIVKNYDESQMTKSTVLITDDEIRTGKNATFENSQNLVYDAKKMIGKKYSDISALKWPFKVEKNSRDCPVIYIPNLTKRRKHYSPEEIVSFILHGLKTIVEDIHFHHGKKLEAAVFTVPAYFNASQREATKIAAIMAGLKVLKLINEPAAAVLAFCYQSFIEILPKEQQNILVYNLGGATFDVSLVKFYNGQIEVKVVNEDINLGGNNFDEKLVEYLTKKFKEITNEDIKDHKKARWRIKAEAKKAKESLSFQNKYKVYLDSLQNDVDFEYEIRRLEFEFICQDLFIQTMQIVEKTMKDANLVPSNIGQVLLVGGSTRIPKIQNMLADKFGKNKINNSIPPDEVIALGAAIQAAIINGEIKGIMGEIEKSEEENIPNFMKTFYTFPDKIITNNSNINVIGIDLGTSRCCAAVNRKHGIETVALDNSDRLLPSYVAYDEKNVKCGRIVIQRLRNHSKSSVFDSKRIIGRRFDEIVIDALWPFRVINEKVVSIETQDHSDKKLINPEEIAAALLKHIKDLAEKFQGKDFNQVVITIPAAFSRSQQEATLKASKLAGFNSIELLPEPIAAAFAYFAEREIPNNSILFLFDLGGGTLDVCIFKIKNNQIHIISNTGDTKLGGRDFDTLLINYFDNILKVKYNITVPVDKKYKLMQNCEKIKENLSYFKNNIGLDVDEFDPTKDGIIYLSREEFETMAKELLEKIKNTVYSALYNSGLKREQITKILQVGGGSRMPMIKKLLQDIFPHAEHCCEQNPDEVVAIGAAYYAYYLKSKPQAVKKYLPASERISSRLESRINSIF